jgi:hypothetical protein
MSGTELGRAVLVIARRAIAQRLGLPAPGAGAHERHERLAQPGASFVTLRSRGELRGCIGSVECFRPLAQDVAENAVGAAFRDPRFAPLTAAELPRISVEVSLLSARELIEAGSEEELLRRLRPGVDGLLIEAVGRRATFLPAVWDMLPEPQEFLAALKHKAGLSTGFWGPQLRASRYTVTKWTEEDAPAGAAAR